jgi:hypothetical protein
VERSGLKFTQAWSAMCDIFNTAGIDITPSVVLQPTSNESKFPIIISSEYVLGVDVLHSSEKTKIHLAKFLGTMLRGQGEYLPHSETLAPDMFKIVTDETGEEKPMLVDIDPYLLPREIATLTEESRDILFSTYIRRSTQLLQNSWCKPNEKEVVMREFIHSVAPILEESRQVGSRTWNAITAAHAVAQGLDIHL